jgi:zinc transporter
VVTRIDTLGDDIAACEDQVLVGTRGELRAQLADQRRRAIALRRFLAPQREAFAKLAQIQLPWLDATARGRILESADRMTRTVEELDAARDRAAVTQEELQSRIGEATNQRLYVLSIITAVFLPLGFVCSLLGVNVGGVPLQHDDWAFWALCGVFAVVVTLQLWLFRRRGWFGG